MNPGIAQALGRPDLSSIPVDNYGGTSGIVQLNVGNPFGSGAVRVGQIQIALWVAATLAVVGFYIWTRDIQA